MHDAAFLHTIDPFLWQITPTFGIRWYGVAYLLGFVVGWWILRTLAKRGAILLNAQQVSDAMLAFVIGVFVGGRLGYVIFYQPSLLLEFSSSPPWWGLLAINRGGMASHGGIIGVIIAAIYIARRNKVSSLHMLDLVAFAAPMGLFFGRIANFINGELLGRIVAMPGEPGPWWSVRYPQELQTRHAPTLTPEQQSELYALLDRVAPAWDEPNGIGYAHAVDRLLAAVQSGAADVARDVAPLLSARHPSQLYQAAAEGLVLMAALMVVWLKPRRPGIVGSWFLIVYGALRIATEHWRLPDDHLAVQRIAGLSRGQWLSVVMALVGVIAIAALSRRKDLPRLGGWLARGVSSEAR